MSGEILTGAEISHSRGVPHGSYRQGLRKAWHMPPSGKLSVGIWKIRLREKWNMVKLDDPQKNRTS
jgi:hypothetical protein